MDEIKKYRDNIDDIDKKIFELIEKRTDNVLEIGDIKKKLNEPIYRPEREAEIFSKLENLSKDSRFPTSSLLSIYKEIISGSRAIEEVLKIAYFGPQASFTHMAAKSEFGTAAEYVHLDSINDVFKEVESGKYKYGIVPIENSNEGAVNYTLDLFLKSNLKIASEIYLSIHHYLLSHCDDMKQIKKIYSHEQALTQCRVWINNNLPNAERISAQSTSEAASVISWDKYGAAIASRIAADEYNLNILAENIEDNSENYTRFLVISKSSGKKKTDNDKTSLIISAKDAPGSLMSILSILSDNNINMSKIESRPNKDKTWEYIFYIDIDGHILDENISKVLDEIKDKTIFLKILGSYPKRTYIVGKAGE